MAYTADQLSALEAAYAEGVLTYEYAGKRITYRSRAEMKQIIDEIRDALRPASQKRRRFSLASFNRR